MTNDFKDQLIEACQAEGRPFLIAIGDSRDRPECGFKVSYDLDGISIRGYESLEESVLAMVAVALREGPVEPDDDKIGAEAELQLTPEQQAELEATIQDAGAGEGPADDDECEEGEEWKK